MIHYPQALEGIEEAVQSESKNWLKKAEARTKLFTQMGRYAEEIVDAAGKRKALSPFWSDVKPVYMRRQHNKCIYCETKLEGKTFSYVQWDLEHFRPKSNVRKWPDEKSAFQYDFETGDESNEGYYLLAYHLRNYAAACKICNSPFKSDYFPVATARASGKPSPLDYAGEEAFLLYPLTTEEDDPEDLITFVGAEAFPKYSLHQDKRKWRRARVIIDFFGLNRDGLLEDRAAWLLEAVWPNIQRAEQGDSRAKSRLEKFCSERGQFTNCTRCFVNLCAEDRNEAENNILVLEETLRRMEE